MDSRTAAIDNTKSLLQDRAQTEAGLVFNGYQCAPPCTVKELGNVRYDIDGIDVSWSLMASLLYLEWRYTCTITVKWNATIACRRP